MTVLTKILNGLLLTAIAILIIMSLLALLFIHWTLSLKYAFSFSPNGINTYLTALSDYKALFTGTIATMAAYFGLHRLKVATDANLQKVKQDRFSEWKSVLDIRFIEIEKQDPFMKREFIRIRHNLYEQLYDRNFNVVDNAQLTQIVQVIFPPTLINFFEIQNNKHIGMGGVYPNNTYAYSFDSFQFLFLGCLDNVYAESRADLLTYYLTQLPPDRLIDSELYSNALRNFRQQ
jgi:hypothetical protein